MSNWINKTFFKSKCVKAIIYCEDKRTRIYYVLPDENKSTITIKELGKTFSIISDGNKRSQYIDTNGFPVYLYHFNRVEAIDPLDAKSLGTRTPAEVSKMLNAKIIQELFGAINANLSGNMMFILVIGVMVLGFGLIYYVFSKDLEAIKNLITNTQLFFRG